MSADDLRPDDQQPGEPDAVTESAPAPKRRRGRTVSQSASAVLPAEADTSLPIEVSITLDAPTPEPAIEQSEPGETDAPPQPMAVPIEVSITLDAPTPEPVIEQSEPGETDAPPQPMAVSAAELPVEASTPTPGPRRRRAAAEANSSAPQIRPAPAPLYGEANGEGAARPEEDIPIGGASANSLYEAELEMRNLADQASSSGFDLRALAAGALKLISENLQRMTEEQVEKVNQMLHGIDLKDYLDPGFWQGIGMVLRYQIDEQVNFIKRRLNGQYVTDPYGMDRELIEVVRPFLSFMYRVWWRVTPEGLEHVPTEGRALLVGNHSGVLPWDGAMIATAVLEDHPAQIDRIVRSLHLHWFSTLPFIAPSLAAMGQVPGLPENAIRLLENDELVCVFPEGLKGVGKLYKDRYKLARFGRGGFVQAAIRAGAPIIPVAVVGAEEIYPMLANVEPLAKLLGMPYFPLTPFFPWLGPLGFIPLPSHWVIIFCEPIRTDMYDPAEADDPLTVLGLSELVRETIQQTIDARLAGRKTIF